MALLWLPWRSCGTRDSASHEGTGHLARRHGCPLLPLTLGFLEHSGLRTTRASIWVGEHQFLPLPHPVSSSSSSSQTFCPGQRWCWIFFILILKAKVAR